MRVAITGGSGQLGTLVLRRLLAERSISEVVALDQKPPVVVGRKLRAETADVRDPDFGRFLQGCDALVHLAFWVTGHAPRQAYDEVNVAGSRNVFQAAARAGIKTIVYSSSIAAYGVVPGHPVPIVEETPRRFQPDFAYSANKFQVEDFLDRFQAEHPEISVARLRPTILLGRYMEHALGDTLRRRMLTSSPGAPPMPIVYDEDVADAVLLALKKKANGAFNLSAEDLLPPRELAQTAGLRVVEAPPVVVRGLAYALPLLGRLGLARSTDPAWLRNQNATMIPSCEKARRELGWSPKCPKAADVLAQTLRVLPRALHPKLQRFFQVLRLSTRYLPAPEGAGHLNLRIHLDLTGQEGGDISLLLENGALRLEFGVPRPLNAIARVSAEDFLSMLNGTLDGSSAQFTGRLRIEGEATASLVVLGVVTMFRAGQEKKGLQGAIPRRLARYLAR